MFALLLFLSAPPAVATPDSIAVALAGLVAVIEEDGNPDRPLITMMTRDCETHVSAQGRDWMIDWHKTDAVALEDTFVFVSAPPVKLAIVGDASKPDQADKLRRLSVAMQDLARRCAVKPA